MQQDLLQQKIRRYHRWSWYFRVPAMMLLLLAWWQPPWTAPLGGRWGALVGVALLLMVATQLSSRGNRLRRER